MGRCSVGKRKSQPELPEIIRVELFWVDERVRVAKRKRITRYTVHDGPREINCARGTLRHPGVAVFESRDPQRVLAWIRARKQEGWITAKQVGEDREKLTIIIRAAQRGKVSDGTYFAHMVHKPSGKGEKGSRKPVRDYRAPASVKNNGTVVGTRVKGMWGA